MKAAVFLNPSTLVSVLKDIINDLNLVLLMSGIPGFCEQQFIQNTIQKVIRLCQLKEEKQANVMIEIEAGVNPGAGKLLFEVGVDVLVAGSFVFSAEYPKMTIHQLKNN